MKKSNILIFILLIITSIIVYNVYNQDYQVHINNIKTPSENNSNMLSIMVKNDNDYEKYTKNDFPKKGYKLNSELSKCANGNKINYDPKTYQITITGANTDKCYLYFDVNNAYDVLCEDNTLTCVVSKRFKSNSTDDIDNVMYYQDGSMRGISYDRSEIYITDEHIDKYAVIDDIVSSYWDRWIDDTLYYLNYMDSMDVMYSSFEEAVKRAYLDGYVDSLKVPIDTNDLSYRFSGNNPDNYVCLGNVDAQGKCLNDDGQVGDDNLYRIIGLFKNEKGNYETKLIKSEYATSAELGLESYEDIVFDEYYEDRKIKASRVEYFHWDGHSEGDGSEEDGSEEYIPINYWNTSVLKEKLNTTFLNNRLSKYKDKIADTKWYIGGMNSEDLKLQNQLTMYQYELGNKKLNSSDQNSMCVNQAGESVNCTDELLYTEPTKIGLMYVSDYTYATAKHIWDIPYFYYYAYHNYSFDDFLYNWLNVGGVCEWVLSRVAGESGYNEGVYNIGNHGYITEYGVDYWDAGVRPTFYLNSNVEYASGDGSYNKPYTIA